MKRLMLLLGMLSFTGLGYGQITIDSLEFVYKTNYFTYDTTTNVIQFPSKRPYEIYGEAGNIIKKGMITKTSVINLFPGTYFIVVGRPERDQMQFDLQNLPPRTFKFRKH
jgi:hypothetical protein